MKGLPLIVLDLETTGLDVLAVDPVEIGMLHIELADDRLVERSAFQAPVPAPPLIEWEQGAREMHASRLARDLFITDYEAEVGRPWGALDELKRPAARQLTRARVELKRRETEHFARTWLDRIAAGRQVVAVGANVGRFDLTILRRTMPVLAARFYYRNLDVSAIKVAATALGWADEPERPKTHRALDDCRATLADLNYYHALLRRGGFASI